MRSDLRLKMLAACLLLGLSIAAHAQVGEKTLPDAGIDQRLGEAVPMDLEFTDAAGRTLPIGNLIRGKPTVLALVYYKCPMLCGQVLNGLLRSLHEISLDVGKDFNVVAVSFDPGETPELAHAKKRKYVSRYDRSGAEAGFHFLTGAPTSIDALTTAVGFRYSYDADARQFAHAAGIIILTPEGRIARYMHGIEYPPHDLRLGLVEASEGAIGSPVDQLLLLCFQYDPTQGRYGLVIFNVLRIAGALTVVLLACAIFLLSRRNRRTCGFPEEGGVERVSRGGGS